MSKKKPTRPENQSLQPRRHTSQRASQRGWVALLFRHPTRAIDKCTDRFGYCKWKSTSTRIRLHCRFSNVRANVRSIRKLLAILRGCMKTQGEIEAAICDGITHFEQEYMGRGPKSIHAHLVGNLVVVRLQGVLTAAEQQLVKTLPHEKGRDLLKQVRTQLLETARPLLEAMVEKVAGVRALSLHHDISTVTGEEVILFTLADSP